MTKLVFKRFSPLIVWALLSLILSSIPGNKFPELQGPFGWDKLIHMVLYMVLGALAVRAWSDKQLAPWLIFLFCVGYGLVDELHQFYIPERYPDVWDWVADSIGSFIGVMSMWFWLRTHPEPVTVPADKVENE